MGRNEIRLRRQNVSSGSMARHRNYSKLMARHERNQRVQRTIRAMIYVVVVIVLIILVILFVMVKHLEQMQHKNPPGKKIQQTETKTAP